MTKQINMTHDQLADLIAEDVRRHAHCEGFSSITLYQLKDGQIPNVNWSAGPINFGTGDEDECVRAMREIIPRMQKQYRFV